MPTPDRYALTPDELVAKLNSARDAQAKRYKGIFEPIVQIARRTFAKRPLLLKDEEVDPSKVKEVSSTLEAALVMAEATRPDAEVVLVVKNIDLAHFVGYMRAVDHYARALAERNGRLITRLEEVSERKTKRGEGAFIQEIAEARQDDYDPFGGAAHARERNALAGEDRRERSSKHPWDLPMAERPEHIGVDMAAGESATAAHILRDK